LVPTAYTAIVLPAVTTAAGLPMMFPPRLRRLVIAPPAALSQTACAAPPTPAGVAPAPVPGSGSAALASRPGPRTHIPGS
jgi:hypothetical protein